MALFCLTNAAAAAAFIIIIILFINILCALAILKTTISD